MGGKRWSAQELSYLRTNVGIIRPSKIASALRRSTDSVNSKITELGLSNMPPSLFTPEMDDVLIKLGAREGSKVLMIEFKKAEARRKYLKRKGRVPPELWNIAAVKPDEDEVDAFTHRWVDARRCKMPIVSAPRSVFDLALAA